MSLLCTPSSTPVFRRTNEATLPGLTARSRTASSSSPSTGWDLADVYVDNDVSAYSGRPRPQYRRLCEDIKAGGIDVVVAWHPDRLHRRPIELEEFINLIEAHHVGVHTITAGYWDLSNPSGKLVARNLGAVARYESEHKSERITRKMAERAQEGKAPAGGARPTGTSEGASP